MTSRPGTRLRLAMKRAQICSLLRELIDPSMIDMATLHQLSNGWIMLRRRLYICTPCSYSRSSPTEHLWIFSTMYHRPSAFQ
jgi:hypothetical protein